MQLLTFDTNDKHNVLDYETKQFWKDSGSPIERTVVGVIAEEGMKQKLERMRLGIVKKARSGRVAA